MRNVKLHLLFVYLPVIIVLTYLVSNKIVDIQKQNDYIRCVNVVRMAKITGKIPRTTDTHEECKYHLE